PTAPCGASPGSRRGRRRRGGTGGRRARGKAGSSRIQPSRGPRQARPASAARRGPRGYGERMPRVRGLELTALGFVLAMLLTVLLVRIDPASEIPGLTQAAPRE